MLIDAAIQHVQTGLQKIRELSGERALELDVWAAVALQETMEIGSMIRGLRMMR